MGLTNHKESLRLKPYHPEEATEGFLHLISVSLKVTLEIAFFGAT